MFDLRSVDNPRSYRFREFLKSSFRFGSVSASEPDVLPVGSKNYDHASNLRVSQKNSKIRKFNFSQENFDTAI